MSWYEIPDIPSVIYIPAFFLFLFDHCLSYSECYQVDDFERIGTGDAFASAVLNGYLNHDSISETVENATIYGALAHTSYGDGPVLDPKLIDVIKQGKIGGLIR